MSEDFFALDIGTRSVVGVVFRPENSEIIKIRSFEVIEHQLRSMYDGQIHDIDNVAATVSDIKNNLEKRLNTKLDSAAIAAAGRSLETERFYLETNIDQNERIDPEQVYALELEAVQKAEQKLYSNMETKQIKDPDYYCVAHSVINYTLNGHAIGNPVGQKGFSLGVEVIATFLPQVVVDGLQGVMDQAGIEIANLTLEPIAAINLAIPSQIRMLNLALIDIGAGTSDIAITDQGSVIAYQMVPQAGDEITDTICQELLVDFHTGEKIKHFLTQDKKSKLNYQDVLGNKQSISKEKIENLMSPQLDRLVAGIGDAILAINGSAPSAVFCVGGGSQLPGLAEKISQYLNLANDKVAIKGNEKWEQVKNLRKGLTGPQGVTPLGIALTSIQSKNFGFIDVTVNDELVRLFQHGPTKVANALVADRYPMKELIPKAGKGLTVWVDDRKFYFPGKPGQGADILVNNQTATLETELKSGDEIHVEPARQGEKPTIQLQHILQEKECDYFYLNGKYTEFPQKILLAGQELKPDNQEKVIAEDCQIETLKINQVHELMKYLEIDVSKYCCYSETRETYLQNQDEVQNKENVTIKTRAKQNRQPEKLGEDTVNNEKSMENALSVIINGEQVQLLEQEQASFLDIFNVVDFDTSMRKGQLIMTINNEPAEFTDPIKNGDELMIYWSEEGPKKLPKL